MGSRVDTPARVLRLKDLVLTSSDWSHWSDRMMSFPGEQTKDLIWKESRKVRGRCVVCGREGNLVARCPRCRKWSCEREGCVRVVKEKRVCAVPAVSL